MKQDLFGDIVIEPLDYAKEIISSLEKKEHILITPNFNTKKGFIKEGKEKFDAVGFYCIYKFKIPVYVGYSNCSIHNRIARFFGSSTGSTLDYEQHAAGKKYAKIYGQNYENLTIKTFHFNFNSLPNIFKMEDIENEIIYILKPCLNCEVYDSVWVSQARINLMTNCEFQ